jgi:hypothetical protein
MGCDSTIAEVELVEHVLPEVIRRAQRLENSAKKL